VAIAVLTRDVSTIGKGNELINVSFPPFVTNSVEFLLVLRGILGIPESNPYLFAKAGTVDRYRNSYPLFRKLANTCGADKPNLLSSQGQRRSLCTAITVSGCVKIHFHINKSL
jgi:hypothetical protein